MSNIEVKSGDSIVINAVTKNISQAIVVSQPTVMTTITGVTGGGGDANFVYSQETVSKTWNVTHGLNKYPSVTIVDEGGNLIVAEVEFIDKNNITIRFEFLTSGKAYIN